MSSKKSTKSGKKITSAGIGRVFVNPLLLQSFTVSVQEPCKVCRKLSPPIAIRALETKIVGERLEWTCAECSATGEAVTTLQPLPDKPIALPAEFRIAKVAARIQFDEDEDDEVENRGTDTEDELHELAVTE